MADNVSDSGVLKRKMEVDETPEIKDKELSSPPAKVRATEENASEPAPSKANVLDVTPGTSTSNQTTATESNGETYGEREKMQCVHGLST